MKVFNMSIFKKPMCILLSVFMLLVYTGCSNRSTHNKNVLTIAVATDLHYLSPTLTDGGEYFQSFVKNSDGKMVHYTEEIVDAFCAEMIEKKPDFLILSGDLTFNGEEESHKALIEKLSLLKNAGINVLVIPGNHDVDSKNAVSFKGDGVEAAKALSSEEFMTGYESFGPSLAVSRDNETFSYSIKAAEDLYIVLLDANCFGQGYLKDSTLQWLEGELERIQSEGARAITVSHQNLYAHNSLLSFGYQLYNAKDLTELLEKYGVKCHLSGHIHMQSIKHDDITEIATSSLAVTPIQYGWAEYENGTLTYSTVQTDVSGWAAKNGSTDEELLNFAEYAEEFFRETGRNQIMSAFEESTLSEEEKELLADTFNDLNVAYFSGTNLDYDGLKEGIDLFNKQESSFISYYISTIINAEPDRTKAVISLGE